MEIWPYVRTCVDIVLGIPLTTSDIVGHVLDIVLSLFVWPFVHLFLKINSPKNGDIKIGTTPMDAHRRKLSNGGLGSVVALSVCWEIDFLCVCNPFFLPKLGISILWCFVFKRDFNIILILKILILVYKCIRLISKKIAFFSLTRNYFVLLSS